MIERSNPEKFGNPYRVALPCSIHEQHIVRRVVRQKVPRGVEHADEPVAEFPFKRFLIGGHVAYDRKTRTARRLRDDSERRRQSTLVDTSNTRSIRKYRQRLFYTHRRRVPSYISGWGIERTSRTSGHYLFGSGTTSFGAYFEHPRPFTGFGYLSNECVIRNIGVNSRRFLSSFVDSERECISRIGTDTIVREQHGDLYRIYSVPEYNTEHRGIPVVTMQKTERILFRIGKLSDTARIRKSAEPRLNFTRGTQCGERLTILVRHRHLKVLPQLFEEFHQFSLLGTGYLNLLGTIQRRLLYEYVYVPELRHTSYDLGKPAFVSENIETTVSP